MHQSETALEQRSLFQGTQKFTVEAEHVRWQIKNMLSLREERIPLSVLSPNPIRHRSPNYKMLYYFSIFAPVLLLITFGGNILAMRVGAFLLSIVSIVTLSIFFASLVERLSFYNKYNGSYVFSFTIDRPSSEVFKSFLNTFTDKIQAAKSVEAASDQSISSEIEKLHALFEKQIITADDFDRLKRDLIESVKNRTIGF